MARYLRAPDDGKRVETGAVRFGDDWTGLFIRGDDAFHLCSSIRAILSALDAVPPQKRIELQSAIVGLCDIAELIEEEVVER